MRFASWNVNSIKVRCETVIEWTINNNIDVLALQEIKCEQNNFPYKLFNSHGYNCEVVGQKSYNGVAIIARKPIKMICNSLPLLSEKDSQSRYLEIEIDNFIFSSIYLPNGNPVNSEKYTYKVSWMERLLSHAKHLLESQKPVLLAGDYNVIPQNIDCWDEKIWKDDALALPEIKGLFRKIENIGYHDAYRLINKFKTEWSFWDYQAGSWNKDNGIRIDHFLINSFAADLLKECKIDKTPRGLKKPSDHVPIWCEF